MGNNVGLTLFITSLSDVGTEAFHFLATLTTFGKQRTEYLTYKHDTEVSIFTLASPCITQF